LYAQQSLHHAEALGLARESMWWAWPIAADAALALSIETEVVQLLEWLDEHPPGHIPPVLRAERLRIRAGLLAARGDPEAGVAFDAATQAFRELGYPYHLAVGLLDHAKHLATIGDTATAHQFADEAEVIAQRLRARPLIDRAQGLSTLPDATLASHSSNLQAQ